VRRVPTRPERVRLTCLPLHRRHAGRRPKSDRGARQAWDPGGNRLKAQWRPHGHADGCSCRPDAHHRARAVGRDFADHRPSSTTTSPSSDTSSVSCSPRRPCVGSNSVSTRYRSPSSGTLYDRTPPSVRTHLHRNVGAARERERSAGVPVAAARRVGFPMASRGPSRQRLAAIPSGCRPGADTALRPNGDGSPTTSPSSKTNVVLNPEPLTKPRRQESDHGELPGSGEWPCI
jgi:hypothetical protein